MKIHPEERRELVAAIKDLIADPTAEVDVCGQFPEDTSTVQNFKQISESQRLYSKEQLLKAYKKGKEEDDSRE